MTNKFDPNDIRIVDGDLSGNCAIVTSDGSLKVTATTNTLQSLIKQTAVVVATTPTKLPTTDLNPRKLIVIFNNSAQVVFLGNVNVNINDGLPIPVGQTITVDANEDVAFYAIAQTGTADIRLLEGS